MRAAITFRQALTIRRQARLLDAQDHTIEGLTAQLRRIQADVELLACTIPPAKRTLALSLVRDRHRIEDGHIIEEAEHG